MLNIRLVSFNVQPNIKSINVRGLPELNVRNRGLHFNFMDAVVLDRNAQNK